MDCSQHPVVLEREIKSIPIYPYSLKKQPRQKIIVVNEMAITMEDDKTVSSSTSSKSLNTTEKKTFRQTSAKDVVDPKTARMTSLSSTKTQANSSKMRPPGTASGKVIIQLGPTKTAENPFYEAK